MNSLTTSILKRHDEGETDAKAIAAAEGVSFGYVYGVLREHRPDRQRKGRTRTSERRTLILGLLSRKIKPSRVAFLAGCSSAYVYKLQHEETAA